MVGLGVVSELRGRREFLHRLLEPLLGHLLDLLVLPLEERSNCLLSGCACDFPVFGLFVNALLLGGSASSLDGLGRLSTGNLLERTDSTCGEGGCSGVKEKRGRDGNCLKAKPIKREDLREHPSWQPKELPCSV